MGWVSAFLIENTSVTEEHPKGRLRGRTPADWDGLRSGSGPPGTNQLDPRAPMRRRPVGVVVVEYFHRACRKAQT